MFPLNNIANFVYKIVIKLNVCHLLDKKINIYHLVSINSSISSLFKW